MRRYPFLPVVPLAVAILVTATIMVPPAIGAEVGLREACRRDLSGMYLTVFSKLRESAKLIAALEDRERLDTPAVKEADKKYRDARSDADRAHFDQDKVELARDREARLKTLSESLAETRQVLARERGARAELVVTEATLKERLGKVFDFVTERLPGQAGDSVRLEYKSSCPRYRSTCPLPKQQAWDLENIVPETPLTCKRYSKVRGPRPE